MKPLAGIRVLDFSRVLAGPMATQIMAEFGAEVIKVERPGTGDESRSFEPKFEGGESGYYFAFNRAKRSITLNLKADAGRRIARDLAARSDVVVENFLPGQMDRMGLGFADLSAANDRLVYISNTGFGQSGPYRDRNGYDTIFQALSGVMDLTGHPDGPPAKVGLPFADLTSGLWIAIAAMTGLLGRAQTGKGCHIDVAMMDVQTSLLTIAAQRYFALGETPTRTGTEHLGRVPSAAFECRDGGWLHISGSDQHWGPLCEVLGLDDLAHDEELKRNAARVARRDEVMTALREAIGRRDRAPLAEALRARGVPAGEVNSVPEILNDAHIRARGMVGTFEHPVSGEVPALRTPLRFEGFDDPEIGVPPLLGADTEELLREELGYDDAAIAALREEGTI
ncbi:CaiB/BaiF CoA transferase family protein [Lutibaculum baratangense]|uniref:L-carnitine dehydratase/bile acid-inducible protein F n=1 Tax=Lutibaculum baratangense AMV1 TaxID=631454 RepID=V4T8Y9_9HYPH|nr:CoA transferase [Lutibaculum baratangense]ESR23008.1 L-carnitine dehydratase/bile acid-inducible protein F [Lutibaculum baratangense AMV1]